MLLALLRLHTNCVLKENVASTGMVSLNGYILGVGAIVDKVKGAIRQGAELVLVPAFHLSDLKGKITSAERARVRFVITVIDVLEHAVVGE